MKKIKSLFPVAIVAIAALFASSCTLMTHKGTSQSSTVMLAKGDYEMSDIKTAKGEAKLLLGFSLGENDKAAEVTTYSTYGSSGFAASSGCCLSSITDPSGMAKSIALYNLLEQNPGYDAVVSPNYKVQTDLPCGSPFLYSKTTVTVSARLIKYKK